MSIEEISAMAAEASNGPEDEWPVLAAALGDRVDAALADPDTLRAVVARVIEIALEHNVRYVTSSSAAGRLIVGATIATGDGLVRALPSEDRVDAVIVVDSVLATGANLARGVQLAVGSGARTVVAVAVTAARRDPPAIDGAARLVVLAPAAR